MSAARSESLLSQSAIGASGQPRLARVAACRDHGNRVDTGPNRELFGESGLPNPRFATNHQQSHSALGGGLPGVDHRAPFRLAASQRVHGRSWRRRTHRLGWVEVEDLAIGDARRRARLDTELLFQERGALLIQMQGRRAIALTRVTAHQGAPRLLIERIETEQLSAALDCLSKSAILFERRNQTPEHQARALVEPFAIGLDPFGGAIRHEIALIERRSFLERGEVSFKSPVRGALERHEVHHRGSILAPCQRARFADDERFEPRPRFPQVMELAPEVRLGLNLCGIRPKRAADTLTRNRTAARRADEKRDESAVDERSGHVRPSGRPTRTLNPPSTSIRSGNAPVTIEDYTGFGA